MDGVGASVGDLLADIGLTLMDVQVEDHHPVGDGLLPDDVHIGVRVTAAARGQPRVVGTVAGERREIAPGAIHEP